MLIEPLKKCPGANTWPASRHIFDITCAGFTKTFSPAESLLTVESYEVDQTPTEEEQMRSWNAPLMKDIYHSVTVKWCFLLNVNGMCLNQRKHPPQVRITHTIQVIYCTWGTWILLSTQGTIIIKNLKSPTTSNAKSISKAIIKQSVHNSRFTDQQDVFSRIQCSFPPAVIMWSRHK